MPESLEGKLGIIVGGSRGAYAYAYGSVLAIYFISLRARLLFILKDGSWLV